MLILIELFGFSFLIMLILFFSPVGKVMAESYFTKKQNNLLLQKYDELNQKFQEHEEEIQKLREIIIFNEDRIKKVENLDYSKLKKIQEQRENI